MTCDFRHPIQKCGWVEVNYPVDTAGNNKIWKCYCKTTMCQKIGTMIFNDNLSISAGQYIQNQLNEELSKVAKNKK